MKNEGRVMLEKILKEIGREITGSMGRKREGLILAEEIIRKYADEDICQDCIFYYNGKIRDHQTHCLLGVGQNEEIGQEVAE